MELHVKVSKKVSQFLTLFSEDILQDVEWFYANPSTEYWDNLEPNVKPLLGVFQMYLRFEKDPVFKKSLGNFLKLMTFLSRHDLLLSQRIMWIVFAFVLDKQLYQYHIMYAPENWKTIEDVKKANQA